MDYISILQHISNELHFLMVKINHLNDNFKEIEIEMLIVWLVILSARGLLNINVKSIKQMPM